MYIIGIGGASASGKTTLLREIQGSLPQDSVAILSQDNYYLKLENQTVDSNGEVNFDLPTALDRTKFFDDLMALQSGQTLQFEEYTFNVSNGAPIVHTVKPAPILLVEGLFVFHYEESAAMFDLRVFVQADNERLLARRIARDTQLRGYSEQAIRYQWDNHVLPAYEAYLLPYLPSAHIVVNNHESLDKGKELLVDHLMAQLARSDGF